MKKSIIILFVLLALGAKGQGNLQFNRVVTLSPGNNYTVPTGKVLKIESINMSSTSLCIPKSGTDNGYCNNGFGQPQIQYTYGVYNAVNYLTIGNVMFTSPSFNGSVNNNSYTSCSTVFNSDCWTYDFGTKTLNCPIWLESGKMVTIHSGVAAILISAIEFNIIP